MMRFIYWIDECMVYSNKMYLNTYCIDTYMLNDSATRYGTYTSNVAWQYIPLDKFPVEFRTQLMLLGVK